MLAERDSTLDVTHAIKISRYLTPQRTMGVAVRDQPAKQYYWDRPLSVLLGVAFAAGLVLDALEEPPYRPDATSTERINWANYDMPPLLVARLRLAG